MSHHHFRALRPVGALEDEGVDDQASGPEDGDQSGYVGGPVLVGQNGVVQAQQQDAEADDQADDKTAVNP